MTSGTLVYFVIFIVSGTSMYFRRCLQWDVGSSPPVERWCILLSSSSVVRRYISPSTSNGTLVYVIVSNTFSGTLVCVIVSGTSMNYFSSYLQWDVGICYRQWYVDVFLFNT